MTREECGDPESFRWEQLARKAGHMVGLELPASSPPPTPGRGEELETEFKHNDP